MNQFLIDMAIIPSLALVIGLVLWALYLRECRLDREFIEEIRRDLLGEEKK